MVISKRWLQCLEVKKFKLFEVNKMSQFLVKMSPKQKRVTVKLKHPNPLFEKWLIEWRDKAQERNSKMVHAFTIALTSLRKYPLPLSYGKDCRILQGFGDKLCNMLDKRLEEYNKNPSPDDLVSNNQKQITLKCKSKAKLKVSANSTTYTPSLRSGSYAILIALYKNSVQPNSVGFMLKSDIIKVGQEFCDASFMKATHGSYYTAWSSMKTLLAKKLITKEGSPAKFSLTDSGNTIAEQLYKDLFNCIALKETENSTSFKNITSLTEKNIDLLSDEDKVKKNLNINAIPSCSSNTDSASQKSDASEQCDTLIFNSGSFDIFLLVDVHETSGNTKNPLDDETIRGLTNLNVPFEIRHLKIGDFIWICRQRESQKELVLPYIIERKRMDDFGASIKDGRFHEQKFRLKQCGIQNLIYLVENYEDEHTGLPVKTLYQAATNTLIQDKFCVKFTDGCRCTLEYLASFTTILKNMFLKKIVISCPKSNLQKVTTQDDLIPLMTFTEFNKTAAKHKNWKVRDMFVRQLLQLKGISVDKALAIVGKYPTPRLLKNAFEECGTAASAEKLLATIQYGKLRKNIGPVISKTLYQLYTCNNY